MLVALSDGEGRGSGSLDPGVRPARRPHGVPGRAPAVGGHRAAAGVTVARERVAEFAERFNAVARAQLAQEDLVPEVHVDLEVSIDDVTPELESVLRHFEPFGVGNPTPALLVRQARLTVAPRDRGARRVETASGASGRATWTRWRGALPIGSRSCRPAAPSMSCSVSSGTIGWASVACRRKVTDFRV